MRAQELMCETMHLKVIEKNENNYMLNSFEHDALVVQNTPLTPKEKKWRKEIKKLGHSMNWMDGFRNSSKYLSRKGVQNACKYGSTDYP